MSFFKEQVKSRSKPRDHLSWLRDGLDFYRIIPFRMTELESPLRINCLVNAMAVVGVRVYNAHLEPCRRRRGKRREGPDSISLTQRTLGIRCFLLSSNTKSPPDVLDVTFRVQNLDVLWPWTSVPQGLAWQEADSRGMPFRLVE